MLPSAGGDFEASLLTQASQASPGQSRLRRGQFRLRRAEETMKADEDHVDRHRFSVKAKKKV